MIDYEATAAAFFKAAAGADTMTDAARAIDQIAARLRADLLAPAAAGDTPPRLRLVELPLLVAYGPEAAADRLRLRLDELALAKRFGDASDVQRMVGLIVDELRHAAVASRKKV